VHDVVGVLRVLWLLGAFDGMSSLPIYAVCAWHDDATAPSTKGSDARFFDGSHLAHGAPGPFVSRRSHNSV